MKNILSIQNKISPEDFAPLDENYFKEESLDTEEIGYWKASCAPCVSRRSPRAS